MRLDAVANSDRIGSLFLSSKSQKKRNTLATPYAFTEHGVTMLASVLRSEKAIQMNIAIVRAFIAMREVSLKYKDLIKQFAELKQNVGEHDVQLRHIYNAIEGLIEEQSAGKKWQGREKIGFRNKQGELPVNRNQLPPHNFSTNPVNDRYIWYTP